MHIHQSKCIFFAHQYLYRTESKINLHCGASILHHNEGLHKIWDSLIVQVKGFMPPKDGISRETPTGKAGGRDVPWHNFPCCSGICYALGQF